METATSNHADHLPEVREKGSDKMARYKHGFEFVTRNLLFLGIYLAGYHHYSIFYITFPSLLPQVLRYWNSKKVLKGRYQKQHILQEHSVTENAEWINQFLEQFWPFLDNIAKTWLIKKLQKIGLSVLRNDKHRFKINNATWGSTSPKISNIRTSTTMNEENEHVLNLDIDMSHDSDSAIDVSYSSMSITSIIRNFCWMGTLRVTLYTCPPSYSWTGFEIMEISFLNEPKIDFELGGMASVLKSLGLIDITHVVSKFLASTKFVLKLAKSSFKHQLNISWELRKKSDVTNLGVKDLIERTYNVMHDSTDFKLAAQTHKDFAGHMNLNKNTISTPLGEQIHIRENSIGQVKVGLRYSLKNEEITI